MGGVIHFSDGFRSVYPAFSTILDDVGAPPRWFLTPGHAPEASLVGGPAIILDTVSYFEQDASLITTLKREVLLGTRLLCLTGREGESEQAHVNDVLKPFGLSLLGERHFRRGRWDSHGIAGPEGDQLPAVPADIIAATDGLAAGVEEVIVEQPAGVRCHGADSHPLLWALSNPDRVEFGDLRRDPMPGDEVVAASWSPPGEAEARTVAMGDGSWLVDKLIGRADNARFARNLARWLAQLGKSDPSESDPTGRT